MIKAIVCSGACRVPGGDCGDPRWHLHAERTAPRPLSNAAPIPAGQDSERTTARWAGAGIACVTFVVPVTPARPYDHAVPRIRYVELASELDTQGTLDLDLRPVLLEVGPARARASGSADITLTKVGDAHLPKVDVGLQREQWQLGAAGFGLALGGTFFHPPGAVIGGIVFWAWGRWRWKNRVP